MIIDVEFKSVIPPLSKEEYDGLEQSIVNEGCRDSLITWQGILIDGHNRYEICTKHGIKYETTEKQFKDRSEVIEWIITNQFGRRNLSLYNRSILALQLKPIFEERAKENLVTHTADGYQGLQKSAKAVDTREELAKIAGVSHDTIHKVEKIEQSATPEIKAQIKSGDVSINQAYQAMRREEKLKAVSEKIENQKDTETKGIDIYNTDRKYNIVYADPAWDYWSGGNKNQNLHYKTMTIQDICELPVKNITDKDCVLFLWVTYPILEQAFEVIKAWGFEYSTAGFVWVKKNKVSDTAFMGCGSWTRANSELCLLATKGNITRIDAGISQVIESPIEEHSKKPAITRELITKLVGELPRIELFSREAVNGWDCWGNEIEGGSK